MCSVNPNLDEDDTNILMPAKEPIGSSSSLCRKCKETVSEIVLQSKFPYCRSCFIEVVSHKFFGSLGKSKLMKPTDKVLVLCSGSQSSAVLLNLIKIGLFERIRKILSQAIVLFIDCGSFLPLSVEERITLVKEIKSMISHFGFKAYYSPLEYTTDYLKDLDDVSWCTTKFFESTSMEHLINEVLRSTAKEDLLIRLRTLTAVKVAQKLGCNKIFLGETNDQIATNILTNVALGRGDQLPLDTGFCDDRFKDIIILRPLRDCSKKEIAFYRLVFDLPYVTYKKSGSLKGNSDSIQKLTEYFVADLQVSFPSTVCMIVGTGNKLGSRFRTGVEENELVCALCRGNKEYHKDGEMTAESATAISRLISTLGSNGFDSKNLTPNCKSNLGKECESEPCNKECHCSNTVIGINFDKIKDGFCYGCQLILNDMKNLNQLPSEILNEAQHKLNLIAMRNEINDFLL